MRLLKINRSGAGEGVTRKNSRMSVRLGLVALAAVCLLYAQKNTDSVKRVSAPRMVRFAVGNTPGSGDTNEVNESNTMKVVHTFTEEQKLARFVLQRVETRFVSSRFGNLV